MIQPFLDSVTEQGELSVVFVDGRCTHAVRKSPARGDFRIQTRFGGTREPVEVDGDELKVAQVAVEAWGRPTLYARADLLTSPDGPLLVELELTEPSLFLLEAPAAAGMLADALLARLLHGSDR